MIVVGNIAVLPSTSVSHSRTAIPNKDRSDQYAAINAVDSISTPKPGEGFCAMSMPQEGEALIWWMADLGELHWVESIVIYGTRGPYCEYPSLPQHTFINHTYQSLRNISIMFFTRNFFHIIINYSSQISVYHHILSWNIRLIYYHITYSIYLDSTLLNSKIYIQMKYIF